MLLPLCANATTSYCMLFVNIAVIVCKCCMLLLACIDAAVNVAAAIPRAIRTCKCWLAVNTA